MAMTVKSGRWSDPTVWDTGAVPGAGAMAHIKAPHQIIYDRESDVILEDVMSEMGSKLTWDSAKETRLRANTVMLSGITEIVDKGLSATPGKPKHEIVFHPIAGKEPGAGMGLGAVFKGPTRIHGYAKKGHLRSGDISIPAGTTTIHVPGLETSGWHDGDELVILGTEYVLPATSDPQYSGPTQYYYAKNGNASAVRTMNSYQFGQDEQRRIVSRNLSSETITLNAPLDFAHTGMTGTLKDGKVVTKHPVIANVSRSIRFRTASAEEDGALDPNADITVLQKRAHLMFMRQPDVDLRYFETKNMGRTSTDPSLWVSGLPYKVGVNSTHQVEALRDAAGGTLLGNPNNVRGRYAIHLHWCGGPHNAAPLVPLIGATAWAPIGGHPIPGWAITQHSTRAAIEDCVVSNVRGAGMVSEVGNELGQWAYNVVTGVRGDGDTIGWGGRGEHFANHNGAVGVAYENQSRVLLMHGNIAGSCQYACLWWAQKDNRVARSPRDVDVRLMDGYIKGSAINSFDLDEAVGHFNPQIPPFLDNEAWACRYGLAVVHRLAASVALSLSDVTPMLIESFHCVNVPFPFDVPQYSNTYYSKDCLFQGPLNMMGSSQGFNLGSVTWNWNIANCHLRNYRYAILDSGAGLNYNGVFVDVTTENVTDFTNTAYYEFNKSDLAARPGLEGVMGPWTDNPVQPTNTARRSARIRTYQSVNRSALPLPYPLEPYGRKLPAGHPPVNYGDAPYFVLGDGTNGAASTVPVAINLTLTAGAGRGQGSVYGIIRDCAGDMRWPDHQSSESFPLNAYIKSHRNLGKLTPEQLVQRRGCWNDAGTWKCRVWFPIADRVSHVKAWFHIDHPLAGFTPEFLALHDLGGPSAAPEWPDTLEAVAAPRSLTPITRSLRFLSRTFLEAVDGQVLSHRLRPNEVMAKMEIAGGTDAARFKIENQRLMWSTSNPAVRPAPYEVTVRATDTWGNTVETAHQVAVISSARVSAVIADDFNRPDEALEAKPAYVRLVGSAGAMTVKSNVVSLALPEKATYDLGSLGTSEQEVTATFVGGGGYVLLRMVDADNWLGFRREDGGGGNTEFYMCVNGVLTRLANFGNVHLVTVRVQGDRMVLRSTGSVTNEPLVQYPKGNFASLLNILDLDPLAEAGTVILPANAPKGTKVGLSRPAATWTSAAWLDNFSAKALES